MGHKIFACGHAPTGIDHCPVCGSTALVEHCTCGSGGHPRRCATHPDAYDAHIAELNGNESTSELRALAQGLRRNGSPMTADAMVRAADRMEALEAVARAAEDVEGWLGACDSCVGDTDDACAACRLRRCLQALREARR